ncbi:hypothetical protein A5656_15645 [Mycobacterium gordonae]|nr:hypothetical protein [Mycobacterium gordonae]OBJ74692.1 hypothetical protein A9W97_10750 [Mycobacterium gordonae]OBK58718.1 hypothetical protein A5656_15645 [Mycobacterium gordonae]
MQTIKLDGRHFGVEWGTPFNGFQAVGTIGALCVALVVFIHNDYVRRKDERREQAEKVTAWILRPHSRIRRSDTDQKGVVAVGLINNSDGVVYELDVDVGCRPWNTYSVRTMELHGYEGLSESTGDFDDPQHYPDRLSVVRGRIDALPPGMWEIELTHSGHLGPRLLEIQFVDAKNVAWRRDVRGYLIELYERQAPTSKQKWDTLSSQDDEDCLIQCPQVTKISAGDRA